MDADWLTIEVYDEALWRMELVASDKICVLHTQVYSNFMKWLMWRIGGYMTGECKVLYQTTRFTFGRV